MGHFEFDQQRSAATNRALAPTSCVCEGHRLVPVEDPDGREVYMRCPSCNPAPVTERQPVANARWKNYDPS